MTQEHASKNNNGATAELLKVEMTLEERVSALEGKVNVLLGLNLAILGAVIARFFGA